MTEHHEDQYITNLKNCRLGSFATMRLENHRQELVDIVAATVALLLSVDETEGSS